MWRGRGKAIGSPSPRQESYDYRANVFDRLTSASCGGSEEGQLSRLSPSIPYAGHTGHGIARWGDFYPSCGSTQTSVDLLGSSTPESSRGYVFAERYPNDARKRQHTSNFDALISAPGAKRPEVQMGPQRQMQNLSAPRSNTELRAPKTAGIRGDRDAPAASP